eukprot:1217704-Rhodomonas_salina.5
MPQGNIFPTLLPIAVHHPVLTNGIQVYVARERESSCGRREERRSSLPIVLGSCDATVGTDTRPMQLGWREYRCQRVGEKVEERASGSGDIRYPSMRGL